MLSLQKISKKRMNIDYNKIGEVISHLSGKMNEFYQKYKEEIKVGAEEISAEFADATAEVKEHFVNELIEFKKKISVTSFDGNCTLYEVEKLTSEKMMECVKKHMVKGSNMVVVYKEENKVFLTYAYEKEILSDENNYYVIIKADELDTDVINLFAEGNLIILQ